MNRLERDILRLGQAEGGAAADYVKAYFGFTPRAALRRLELHRFVKHDADRYVTTARGSEALVAASLGAEAGGSR